MVAHLVDELGAPGTIVLAGGHGSGRSHIMRAVASALQTAGRPVLRCSAREPQARDSIEHEPPGHVVLVDDAEHAAPELILSLIDRIRNGASVLCAVAADLSTDDEHRAAEWAKLLTPEHDDAPVTRYVHLNPLTLPETLQIAVEVATTPLDSSVLAALHSMSWGRPAWLIEVIRLAAQGAVIATPWPRLAPTQISESGIPTLEFAHALAQRSLTDAEIAAATTLAQLEPRTLFGHEDLVGSAAVASLVAHGVLIQTPTDPTTYGVPELFAAGMRVRTKADIVASAEQRAARTLLLQESLGVPLSDREAHFCTTITDGGEIHQQLDPARADLFRRVALDALSFGAGTECRDLLVRGAGFGATLDPLDRARAATVMHGALAGLRSLNAVPEHASGTASQRIAAIALTSQITAESPIPQQARTGAFPGADTGASERDARFVFARWNETGPVGSDTEALHRIATTHPAREVALLAGQLIDLENIKRGRRPSDPASCTERIARVTDIAVSSQPELRDLLSAAIVTEAMLALYLGDTDGSDVALYALTESLPASTRHRVWLGHLGAVGQAIASGDMARALREWELFEARLPRFLPVRLSALIRDTGSAILRTATGHVDLDGNGEDIVDDFPTQVLAYFSGRLDRIGSRVRRYDHLHESPLDTSRALDIAKLARAHVQAANEQHPVALLQCADALTEAGFWAPAAFALRAAKRIFMRRRATGSVNRCDTKLAELEAAARRVDPWFRVDLLPASEHVRLTPRESATARLVAEGLSNKAIASRLRCSVRTVESHIAHARAKLSAGDRGELAALVRQAQVPGEERERPDLRRQRLDSRLIDSMR
ncbi:LuxR C-terminal-related transcriptional regulator [Leucobacter sp. L43]|uniref:helix-turn-helix transcriptional regulator n=1 Tax=Leucobacter sp. L43 TaxID=2798040 RepID=UPI001F3ED5E5|nr:LuxR C-terminal-related transcriptional regulator [Leucobacter sp. L43]